ncbi:MAG: nucleotide exchange factor GrpE [Spirochaetes bacterium]|nr:nucleotide exchange factor GrpE [Spirochaetota bacterium]
MSETKDTHNEELNPQFATEQEEIDSINAKAEAAPENTADGANELQLLKNQIVSLTGDLQRERAEFSNFRKRAMTEKAQQAAQTSARLLGDLLPALDAFDQFFASYGPKAEAESAIKAIVDGVALIQKQITRVFSEAGVEEFNPLGQEFDPSIMEALTAQEGDVDKETVSQVFQKGYRIEGRLIRAARVIVAKPKATNEGVQSV